MITKFLFVVSAYGIRDANAYILVFDLLCPDSFEYVSGMYSQINEGRDLGRVPVVVVGNKVAFINYVENFLVPMAPSMTSKTLGSQQDVAVMEFAVVMQILLVPSENCNKGHFSII